MWPELITPCLLIMVAEIGDKSQILAMTFATKYRLSQVFVGVALGALLNHGLAVLLGSSLGKIIPMDLVKVIAGFSFLIFAFWSLVNKEATLENRPKNKRGPIFAVTTSFFLSELGDKTQLTTIALASGSQRPLLILIGTVTGMIISGICGIIVGNRMGKRLPQLAQKLLSAGVFLFYGLIYLYQNIAPVYLRPENIFWAIILIGLGFIYIWNQKS